MQISKGYRARVILQGVIAGGGGGTAVPGNNNPYRTSVGVGVGAAGSYGRFLLSR